MLYQYKKFNQNTISSLILNKIWFSTPDSFNDPYDSHVRFYYHGTQEDWIKFLTTTKPWAHKPEPYISLMKQNIKRFEEHFNKENTPINNKMRVACFSQSPTNFLMWSHYSDFHKGICIGYSTLKKTEKNIVYLEINDNQIESLNFEDLQYLPVIKVDYDDKIQYEFNQLTQSTEALGQLVLKKSNIWKYEKEWRILHRYVEHENINLAKNTVNAIYIGSKMKIDDELLVHEIVNNLNAKRSKKIKLYKIYLNEQKNKLAKKKCEI